MEFSPAISLSAEAAAECDCAIEDLMIEPFAKKNFAEKLNIVSKGRPTPLMEGLHKVTKQCKRHLRQQNYDAIPWLCGCEKLGKLYCWPCLLFSTEANSWTKSGVSDLNNLHNFQKRHELTKAHTMAYIAMKQFGKSKIEIGMSEQFKISDDKHNELVRKHRYAFNRLIDVTCFLAENEIGFRLSGPPVCDDEERDNFVEAVKLLRSQDREFDAYFESTTMPIELTPDVQKDLIECVSEVVLSEMKKEIKESQFVSIVLNEITDSENKRLVATVLRYVNDRAEIRERFVCCQDFSSSQTTTGIAEYVDNTLEQFVCREKVVSQTYDGTAMSGVDHQPLAWQIKAKCPLALSTGYYDLRVNSALKHSVSHLKQCKIFFATLSGLSDYFARLPSRAAALENEIKEVDPAAASISWKNNEKLLSTVVQRKAEMENFFRRVIMHRDEWDVESYNGAKGFLSTFVDFDFNFMLKLFSSLLPPIELAFQDLQSKVFKIDVSNDTMSYVENFCDQSRDNFEDFWEKIAVSEEMPSSPVSKKVKTEETTEDRKESYRKIYYEVIDYIMKGVDLRFADYCRLKFLALVDHTRFKEFATNFPEELFSSLRKFYEQCFEFPRLRNELSAVYSNSQFSYYDVFDLVNYLHMGDFKDALPQLYKLACLIVTIPATDFTDGAPISTVKRVETYLQSSLPQPIFAALSLLSIEKNLLSSLKKKPDFRKHVIELFAKKPRRTELLYK